MKKAKTPKLSKEKPALRRARLQRARKKHVSNQQTHEVLQKFAKQLELLHNHPLKNWRVVCNLPDFSSEKTIWANVELQYSGKKIANATIQSRMVNGKRELEIYEFQGTLNSAEQHAGFKKEGEKPWKTTLVQAIIDAAYWADFDRVLLRDITTTLSYKSPHVTENEVKKVKTRMREQYLKVKQSCNLNKEEWRGPAHYWIREFP